MKNKKKTRIIRNTVVTVAVVAFLGWFASLKLDNSSMDSTYDFVIPYAERDISSYFPAYGTIVMYDNTVISSDVTQKISKVNYKVGDIVAEGDVLCEFESEYLDEQIEKMESYISDTRNLENLNDRNNQTNDSNTKKSRELELKSTKLELDAAKSRYDEARSKYGEYYGKYCSASTETEIQLYYSKFLEYGSELETLQKDLENAQKQYDKAQENYQRELEEEQLQADIDSINTSELDKYEEKLAKLKEERDNLIVKSTRAGVISDCFVVEGGYSDGGELFKLGTMGKYKVEGYVSQSYILDIKKGMKVEFHTELTGDEIITGYVTKISDLPVNGMYTFEAEISDEAEMKNLKPNITANIKIFTADYGKCNAVPQDAVFEEDGQKYVYKAVKDAKGYTAEKVRVETGDGVDYYISITDSELETGDLILGSAENYRSGERLKIKE